MGNSGAVAIAKQQPDKNFCSGSLENIELCEKGIHQVWSVDEFGQAQELVETYSMEAFYAYYYCNECGETWDVFEMGGTEEAFNKVKEHFRES